MNAREYFNLTANMRDAQKNYFKLRKQSANKAEIQAALQRSKYLESQVDAEISRVKTVLANQQKQ